MAPITVIQMLVAISKKYKYLKYLAKQTLSDINDPKWHLYPVEFHG